MSSLAFHVIIGLVWGAIFAFAARKDGKSAALKLGLQVAVFMAVFSAGCESLMPIDVGDCRPAGPGIYNDC